jgi:predicted Zn finger-like uncharacterized protein
MPFPFACPHCGATYRIKDELAGKRAVCKKCGKTMELRAAERETSAGGSVMLRHQAREREFEWSHGDVDLMEAIDGHIARHVGEVESVFHELLSDMIHVDVHIVRPTKARPWITLITSGMSERPMHPPEEVEDFDYLELSICLPPKWPLDEESIMDDNHGWPISALKYLARMPHEYETWLGPGHTIPTGDPPTPIASRTPFCCFMVTELVGPPPEFATLKLDDGRVINFCSVMPLYREEMDFKLRKGSDPLMERLGELKVVELCDPKRRNVAKKRFGLF